MIRTCLAVLLSGVLACEAPPSGPGQPRPADGGPPDSVEDPPSVFTASLYHPDPGLTPGRVGVIGGDIYVLHQLADPADTFQIRTLRFDPGPRALQPGPADPTLFASPGGAAVAGDFSLESYVVTTRYEGAAELRNAYFCDGKFVCRCTYDSVLVGQTYAGGPCNKLNIDMLPPMDLRALEVDTSGDVMATIGPTGQIRARSARYSPYGDYFIDSSVTHGRVALAFTLSAPRQHRLMAAWQEDGRPPVLRAYAQDAPSSTGFSPDPGLAGSLNTAAAGLGTGPLRALAAGDLNGDRVADLALVLGQEVHVLINQGEDGHRPIRRAATLPDGFVVSDMAIEQVDGDVAGRKDVLLASSAQHALLLYFNLSH